MARLSCKSYVMGMLCDCMMVVYVSHDAEFMAKLKSTTRA